MRARRKRSSKKRTAVRKVAVFIHIFGTSGDSFVCEVKQKLGDQNFRVAHGEDAISNSSMKILRNKDISGLAGHFTYRTVSGILSELNEIQPKYFSLVSPPVERLVSIYNYSKDRPTSKWGDASAEFDINTFLDHAFSTHPAMIVGHQCSLLAKSGQRMFSEAKENIMENFAAVGVSSDISSTNSELKNTIGIEVFSNAMQDIPTPHASVDDISPEVLKWLEPAVEEDQKLYEWVVDRVSQKLDVN